MLQCACLVVVFAAACGPGKGEDGEKGDKGDKGDTGSIGMQGSQGAPGPTGTTGQKIVEVAGTGQLQVTSSTTFYTTIPGLSTSVDIPAGASVHVDTSGGIQCTQAGSAYSVVDVAIFVDGAPSINGGQRRVVAANTTTVGQMIASWSFGRSFALSAGTHVFEVKAIAVDPNAAIANVSSASAPQLQGVLTVSVLKP